jgi:hypothetical protein
MNSAMPWLARCADGHHLYHILFFPGDTSKQVVGIILLAFVGATKELFLFPMDACIVDQNTMSGIALDDAVSCICLLRMHGYCLTPLEKCLLFALVALLLPCRASILQGWC